ncbi:hypothetical protein IWQ57_004152, partial [Coemansia nantahalensis]
MSSRAVRRFLKERGYDDLAETSARIERNAPKPADDEAESGDDASGSGAQGNMFDLLMGGEASGDEASDRSADEDVRKPAPADAKPAGAAKKGKRGRGGKAKAKAKKGPGGAADDMSMAEFEAQLESARKQAAAADLAPGAPGEGKGKDGSGRGEALGVVLTEEQQQNRALLVVDTKFLDSEAEIKRLFGSA